MSRIQQAILGIAISAASLPGWSQDFVNVYEIPHNVSINVISNQLMHERLNKTLHHWDRYEEQQKQARAAGLPLAKATGSGVSELAAGLPRDQAAAGTAAYRQALGFHEQVIRKFGLPSGDLGVAFASCIAGAWMAYNNQPFPDAFYLPLVGQMRQVVGSKAGELQALSAAQRGSTYESLAIAGMILASSQITWQRNPGAAGADELRQRMRKQGGEVLTRMLQLPPERVGIGASGVFALPTAGR